MRGVSLVEAELDRLMPDRVNLRPTQTHAASAGNGTIARPCTTAPSDAR
jgi:hypothetical protein